MKSLTEFSEELTHITNTGSLLLYSHGSDGDQDTKVRRSQRGQVTLVQFSESLSSRNDEWSLTCVRRCRCAQGTPDVSGLDSGSFCCLKIFSWCSWALLRFHWSPADTCTQTHIYSHTRPYRDRLWFSMLHIFTCYSAVKHQSAYVFHHTESDGEYHTSHATLRKILKTLSQLFYDDICIPSENSTGVMSWNLYRWRLLTFRDIYAFAWRKLRKTSVYMLLQYNKQYFSKLNH